MKEPKIRFKGFRGEWEKVQLNSFAKRVTRKNSHLESTLALTIASAHGLVSQIDYFNNLVVGSNISNYYLLNKGEFAYNKSYSNGYPFGSVKRLDKYEQGILSTLYITFCIDDSISSDYLTHYFDTTLWHRDVAENAAEGARNHGLLNISAEDFFKIKIVKPQSKAEQRAIASYFTTLDCLINLQSQRLEKLKQVKAASLQSMFPQEGETTPRVRFKGFEGEWEECLLKDKVNNITTGKLDANAMVPNGKYRFYTCGKEYFKIDKYAFDDEALLISGNGENVGYIHYYNGKFNAYQRTYVLTSFTLNVFYLEHYLKARLSIRINKEKSVANTPYIKMDTISDMNVLYPNDIAEQRAIASYFTTLDRQITLQTQRLEKLKQIKAACLDKMFV